MTAMRFVVAAVAIAPFIAVAIGMLAGRVQARSCCTVERDLDARLRDMPRADGSR